MNNLQSIKLTFNQQGVSLVGLMIAMVISLMTLAAASMLFQQSYRISHSLSNEAIIEGAISTAFSQIQLEVLNAGFGLTSNVPAHFVIKDGNSIYWRYDLKDSNGVICKGFKQISSSNQLEFQWVEATCDETTELTAINTWSASGESNILEKSSNTILVFSASSSECWPYVDGTVATHINFTIKAKINNESGIEYIQSVCLVNT
ncbi:PilW family protein [Marinicellulosiphila megalodicopiae]|uniref:PilW family protein n=1 Tax=Marinicellulosiphila megalodicopiae TaxID=2724896 RepID=UPI003BAFB33C